MSTSHRHGAVQHWVTVRPEPAGQFTAQAVGLPDVCATAATSDEAIARVREMLREQIASGHLASVEVQSENALLNWEFSDPNDPEEQAFLTELARSKQEDLEQTLRELDQECSNSSSTPTT